MVVAVSPVWGGEVGVVEFAVGGAPPCGGGTDLTFVDLDKVDDQVDGLGLSVGGASL